ncbi:RNA polymerase sigma factor [Actinoplanes sp. NPDC000266]
MISPPPDEQTRAQLRVLIVAHHSGIVSRLAFWSGDRDLAEECAQQVWVQVAENPAEILQDPKPLQTLVQKAWNVLHNDRRRRGRRGEQQPGGDTIAALSDNANAERFGRRLLRLRPGRRDRDTRAVPQAAVDSCADPATAVDRRIDLTTAISQLSDRQQEALYLHYRDDLSPAGIALRMGISRQAAEKLLKSAFAALRKSPRLADWTEEVGR